MVLELCGFRSLQTELGSSVLVTGTLLSLIMVLLSLGYYAGGRLSARWRRASVLLALLALAGAYTEASSTWWNDPLRFAALALHARFAGNTGLDTGLPAAALSLAWYGPPVFLISMISPFCIGLCCAPASGRAGRPGLESGRFMALSTAGSIFGTLLAAYLGIPFYGVEATARASNAVFVALVLLGVLLVAARRLRPAPVESMLSGGSRL
jgi:hypothetical protein